MPAVCQRPRPNFLFARLRYTPALFARFVLIHSNYFAVCQNFKNRRRHTAQIIARQQRHDWDIVAKCNRRRRTLMSGRS